MNLSLNLIRVETDELPNELRVGKFWEWTVVSISGENLRFESELARHLGTKLKRNLESFPISIDNNHHTQLVKKRRFGDKNGFTFALVLHGPPLKLNHSQIRRMKFKM